MGHVLRLAPVTQTKHYYCQTPIDGDTVCGFRWTPRRTVRGEGQLPSRLYALWSRLPPHGQGDETAPPAETTETHAGSGLPSRPRPGLRRPNRTATVLSVRGDHQ